jgi:hypothetical protein
MTGDLSDFVSRLWAVLPKRWFSEQSPILESLLRSIGTTWVWLYGLTMYVTTQMRLMTATDQWLDLTATDYFGTSLRRKTSESDFAYRGRIQAALLQEAATRSAVAAALNRLTGAGPIIFEPANCMDAGSYGSMTNAADMPYTGMVYGSVGGWGSLQLPLQFFVTTRAPPTPGVAMLAGYGTPAGSYGGGVISYIDLSLLQGHLTDADIQATLCSLLPINAVAWLRII